MDYSIIDVGMRPIIKNLNDKRYTTCACCEGHPNSKTKNTIDIYIMFADDYRFDSLPCENILINKMSRFPRCLYWRINKRYNNLKVHSDSRELIRLSILKEIEKWTEQLEDKNVHNNSKT